MYNVVFYIVCHALQVSNEFLLRGKKRENEKAVLDFTSLIKKKKPISKHKTEQKQIQSKAKQTNNNKRRSIVITHNNNSN